MPKLSKKKEKLSQIATDVQTNYLRLNSEVQEILKRLKSPPTTLDKLDKLARDAEEVLKDTMKEFEAVKRISEVLYSKKYFI